MEKEDEGGLERLVGGMSLKNLAVNVSGDKIMKGPSLPLNAESKSPTLEKPADEKPEQ